jgi:hypothetical protein
VAVLVEPIQAAEAEPVVTGHQLWLELVLQQTTQLQLALVALAILAEAQQQVIHNLVLSPQQAEAEAALPQIQQV